MSNPLPANTRARFTIELRTDGTTCLRTESNSHEAPASLLAQAMTVLEAELTEAQSCRAHTTI